MSSTIYIGTNLEDQILPFWTLHFMDHNIHLFNHILKYLLIILREEINVCVFTVQVSGIHLRCTLDVGHCMSGFFGFPSSIIGEMQSSKLMCAPDCKSGSTTVWFSPYPSKYYGADRLQKGASATQWGRFSKIVQTIHRALLLFSKINKDLPTYIKLIYLCSIG